MACINKQIVLATNAAAGNGSAVMWLGGKGIFFAEGTGTGTLALQTLSPNGTWVPVLSATGTAVSLTANGAQYFECCAGQLRLASATFTAIFAYVVGLEQ